MTTWHSEPYQLNEAFIPDDKWILNRKDDDDDKWILNRKDDEGDNSPMSEFAELNAAVLEIIHNKKRFPSNDEMLMIKCIGNFSRLQSAVAVLAEEVTTDNKEIGMFDWNDQHMMTWANTSPVLSITDDPNVGSCTNDTITFVCGGFEPLPPSALISTKGCNKYNTSEKFLNEIKNYE